MSLPKTTPPLDGPPVIASHTAELAKTGVAVGSRSMINAEVTIARLKTFASGRTYVNHLSRFFRFMVERDREPIDATNDDLDVFLVTMHHLAQATQGCAWGVLNSYFKRAVEREERLRNPFVGRRHPDPQPVTPTPALQLSEAQMLLDGTAAEFNHPDRDLISRRDYALMAAMMFLCLRATEVSAVTWSGISRTSGALTISFIGKGRKQATIGLPEPVYEALLMWKGTYEKAIGAALLPTDPIFLGTDYEGLKKARDRKNRKPLTRLGTRSVSRIVADRISDLELNLIGGMRGSRFAAHCLRATGATLALEGGADLIDIQALLRHIQLETTQNYLRRLDARKVKASAFIGLSLAAGIGDDALNDEGIEAAGAAVAEQAVDGGGGAPAPLAQSSGANDSRAAVGNSSFLAQLQEVG